MGLVEYSDSASEDEVTSERASKRRKRGGTSSPPPPPPPPLPTAFHDLYAGAARVSSSDDPSLHGGRKRIVPHVEGNWAAHVYLEWHPPRPAQDLLTILLSTLDKKSTTIETDTDGPRHPQCPHTTTLLENDLGVPLPLHISLSAPLILTTGTKDAFHAALLSSLRTTISKLDIRHGGTLTVRPTALAWHGNAEGTRRFLVLRVAGKDGGDRSALMGLLEAGNGVARRWGLGELYAERRGGDERGGGIEDGDGDRVGGRESFRAVARDTVMDGGDLKARRGGGTIDVKDTTVKEGTVGLDVLECVHISIAWSLGAGDGSGEVDLSEEGQKAMDKVAELEIAFKDVKVKLGRDVTSVPFGRFRGGR